MDGLFFFLIVTLLIVGGTGISLRLYTHGGIWRRSQRVPSTLMESTTSAEAEYIGYETSRYARRIILASVFIVAMLIAIIISLFSALLH
jgi:hypothetical protein